MKPEQEIRELKSRILALEVLCHNNYAHDLIEIGN